MTLEPPTPEEARVIRRLHALARDWPDSLWLFSASGQLCVMRCDENGERVYTPGEAGGVDQKCILDTIDIPNDGGDW